MNIIDRIGELRAEIAELRSELGALERRMKDAPDGPYEGELFRATVSTSNRCCIDWAAIAERLEPSRQLVRAHTEWRPVTTLRVSARRAA